MPQENAPVGNKFIFSCAVFSWLQLSVCIAWQRQLKQWQQLTRVLPSVGKIIYSCTRKVSVRRGKQFGSPPARSGILHRQAFEGSWEERPCVVTSRWRWQIIGSTISGNNHLICDVHTGAYSVPKDCTNITLIKSQRHSVSSAILLLMSLCVCVGVCEREIICGAETLRKQFTLLWKQRSGVVPLVVCVWNCMSGQALHDYKSLWRMSHSEMSFSSLDMAKMKQM